MQTTAADKAKPAKSESKPDDAPRASAEPADSTAVYAVAAEAPAAVVEAKVEEEICGRQASAETPPADKEKPAEGA